MCTERRESTLIHLRVIIGPLASYIILALCLSLNACENTVSSHSLKSTTPTLIPTLTPLINRVTLSDPLISTQCLAFDERGDLWFTSGSEGGSALLRRSTSQDSSVASWTRWDLEDYFAEGCVVDDQEALILTWRARKALIFDLDEERVSESVPLLTEGWGLTRSPTSLIYSDGSSSLRWITLERSSELPKQKNDVQVTRESSVRADGILVYQLNELEWFDGLLLANLYPHDLIAVIEPARSEVIAWLDLSALRALEPPESRELNGIAYNGKDDSLWVTGKGWSHLYEIDLSWLRSELSHLSL